MEGVKTRRDRVKTCRDKFIDVKKYVHMVDLCNQLGRIQGGRHGANVTKHESGVKVVSIASRKRHTSKNR
jgi:hypothetical protein